MRIDYNSLVATITDDYWATRPTELKFGKTKDNFGLVGISQKSTCEFFPTLEGTIYQEGIPYDFLVFPSDRIEFVDEIPPKHMDLNGIIQEAALEKDKKLDDLYLFN